MPYDPRIWISVMPQPVIPFDGEDSLSLRVRMQARAIYAYDALERLFPGIAPEATRHGGLIIQVSIPVGEYTAVFGDIDPNVSHYRNLAVPAGIRRVVCRMTRDDPPAEALAEEALCDSLSIDDKCTFTPVMPTRPFR